MGVAIGSLGILASAFTYNLRFPTRCSTDEPAFITMDLEILTQLQAGTSKAIQSVSQADGNKRILL